MEFERDKRYKGIKLLLEKGEIKTLAGIIDDHSFPISALAEYFSTNTTRMRRLINAPGSFTMDDLIMIAKYFDVKDQIIIDMAYKQAKKRF